MIFGWSGGLLVPESFFRLYPGLTSWAIVGRPSGAGVWSFCSASPPELKSCPPTMMIFKLSTWLS